MKAELKAIILAAGFGTRLRPLTDKTPKPLLPVGGRPMICYSLLLLKKYGVTDVIINLHHHAGKIMDALGDGSRFGLSISYSKESEIMGTGGGIKKAAVLLGQSPFIVINSDILIDIKLDKLLEYHRRKKAKATLVLRKTDELEKFGTIGIDSSRKIRNILGKIDAKHGELQKYMFTGLHILEPSVLDYLPSNRFYSIIDAYIAMLRAGENLFAYIHNGYWNDLGEIHRYKAINDEIKKGKHPLTIE